MNADSVKARLKNIAEKEGRVFQEILITYGLERTIFRISISDYADNFVLKGGILLYALFDKNFARATADVDFLAQRMSNNINEIGDVFERIFSINADDALNYDLQTLQVEAITEFKDYHGVNVSITAYLDKTRIPVSIDIGYGDVLYPEQEHMEFPVLLDMKVPKINAYSRYTVIAEKFEAIVSLGYANSRYKDFYDIYVLASSYDFEGEKLQRAIRETFLHRKTSFGDIVAFEEQFADDDVRKKRWRAFVKKKNVSGAEGFAKVLKLIKQFLKPVVDDITGITICGKTWKHKVEDWT